MTDTLRQIAQIKRWQKSPELQLTVENMIDTTFRCDCWLALTSETFMGNQNHHSLYELLQKYVSEQ